MIKNQKEAIRLSFLIEAVAKNWIKNSSYEEIICVLHHQDAKGDDNCFGSKRHIFLHRLKRSARKKHRCLNGCAMILL
jgi:hypothetical protein